MEDFQLDLIIGEGPAARSVRIDLPPFTLVGATTRAGLHHTPLRDRFGIPLRLVFYEPAELTRSSRAARACSAVELDAGGRGARSRGARAARRAWRRGCCAGCAISPPSPALARSTRARPTPR